MGNNSSLEVRAGSTVFVPGDWVSGLLIVSLPKDAGRSELERFSFKFRSTVRNSHNPVRLDKSNPWYNDHTRVGTQSYHHYELDVPLAVQPMSLPAGDHSFPFTFQLPPNLPATFCREGECNTASLHHYLKCSFRQPPSSPGVKGQRMACHKLPLRIFSGPPPKACSLLVFPEHHALLRSCCFGGGEVVVRMDIAGPGAVERLEDVPMKLELENRSTHTFTHVVLDVVEEVAYECHGQHKIVTAHSVVEHALQPAMEPGQLRTPIDTQAGRHQVCVPATLQPSVHIPRWLECKHYWQVTLVNKAGPKTAVVARSLPVAVHEQAALVPVAPYVASSPGHAVRAAAMPSFVEAPGPASGSIARRPARVPQAWAE